MALATPALATAQPADDAAEFQPAQPDFNLIGLPTGLRVPTMKSAFRVTHRFTRPLGDGSFGELSEDFFGLDSGAQIGLEFRFGLMPNTQVGIHRTSNRTIEFFGFYDLWQQASHGVNIAAILSLEGTNNFKDSYSPTLGAIVSRAFGEHAAVYLEPMWVNNTNQAPSDIVDENDTFLVGIGGRVRIRPSVYLVGEVAPRPSGYKPGVTHGGFGIEKRVGGHLFQVNFSNAFGTTFAQMARGGPEENEWFLGFNISRKFY
jgi:hypothetical protein